MTRHFLLTVALALALVSPANGQTKDGKPTPSNTSLGFAAQAPERNGQHFQISPEISPVKGFEFLDFRLAKSVLLTDETGATDFHQTEGLSDRVQVKKVFHL